MSLKYFYANKILFYRKIKFEIFQKYSSESEKYNKVSRFIWQLMQEKLCEILIKFKSLYCIKRLISKYKI